MTKNARYETTNAQRKNNCNKKPAFEFSNSYWNRKTEGLKSVLLTRNLNSSLRKHAY